MCIRDSYWHAPVREDTLNVISLEFSRTPLAAHVRSPALVRRLDWIDNCFPDAYRARGEYPQTQYYCLMSTGGCYTDFHVDFGGTAVWYHVFRGRKVFYVLEPTAANLAAYERWICDADQDSTWFPDVAAAGGPCACARVEVRAGETFFIPSGWIHAVHTPADSLVFGGNFLPGLCTADLQLAVHDIEARTHVKQEYRFPFFVPCMFWGVKCALDRLNERPDGLGPHERRGLAALVAACGAWARAGCARIHCARQRGMALLAATDAGFDSPASVAAPPPPPAPEAVAPRPAIAPAPDAPDAPAADPEAAARLDRRFRAELEFVQCLASPLYLEYLAQHNYLENDKFMNFLRYLKYFERPEYVRFVEYPDCLGFLELLLTSKKFRDDVRGAGCRDWVHQQQFEAWRTAHARAHATPDLLKPLRDAQLPARPVTQADLEATVDAPA